MHHSSRQSAETLRAPRRRGLRSEVVLLALVAAMHGGAAQAGTATESPAPSPAQAQARPPATRSPFTLRVTAPEGVINLAVTAEDARLSALAADLSTRLGAPVTVGPSLAEQMVTVTVLESPLDQALASLAPRVIIDYAVRQDAPPAPQRVFLLGADDAEPSRNTSARGTSQGLLITGHTEDSTTTSPDDPLKVMGDKRALSISSKKQPLGIVAVAIGEVLGVPVEQQFDATELIDAEISEALPEEAIVRLSRNIAAYVRVDMSRSERTLLKILVAPPRVSGPPRAR